MNRKLLIISGTVRTKILCIKTSVQAIRRLLYNTVVALVTCPGSQITITLCLDFCQSVCIDLTIDAGALGALTANLIELPF